MSEKALIKMKDGTEYVRTAQPYDEFWSKVTALPDGWENYACIYCSTDLERAIRKRWNDLGIALDNGQRVPLKGLGDLPLERAAALHARFDILDTPHGATVHTTDGPAGASGSDPFG